MGRNQRLIATNRPEFVTLLRLGFRTLKVMCLCWCFPPLTLDASKIVYSLSFAAYIGLQSALIEDVQTLTEGFALSKGPARNLCTKIPHKNAENLQLERKELGP